jgi:hypothetical protein
MIERGEDLCFPLEPSQAFRIVREQIREDFDRDVTM